MDVISGCAHAQGDAHTTGIGATVCRPCFLLFFSSILRDLYGKFSSSSHHLDFAKLKATALRILTPGYPAKENLLLNVD